MLRGLGLIELLILIPVLLICMTVHEISHGYVAYLMGDKTAKHMGRLSLNPIRHIDWLGLLLLVTVGFGWAKSVPVNMYNFKNPKRGMAITALAGPLSNIILAFFGSFVYVVIYVHFNDLINNAIVESILVLFIRYNCVFAMFNFIPISPLDGSKILFAILPSKVYYKIMEYERYGMIIMVLLLYTNVLTPVLERGVWNLMNAIFFIINLLPI